MVDNISNTRGIGRGVTRYAPSPATSTDSVRAVAPSPDSSEREKHEGRGHEPEADEQPEEAMRLEIAEDPADGELVYRFVDAKSGDVVRQWDSRDLGRLRDYVRTQRIHLIDKKI